MRRRDPSLRPRVLHIGDGWVTGRPGGLARYQADLAAALAHAGAAQRHLVVDAGGPMPVGVVAASHDRRAAPLRLLGTWWAGWRMAADVDLIDVHFAPYALLPLHVGPLRRCPVVVHFQGPWADEGLEEGQRPASAMVKRLVERAVYAKAQKVITLSQAFADIAVQRYGIPAPAVTVIPPGVDIERFHPGDRRAARRRLHLDEEGPVVVCVRRLVPRMGIDILLRAWSAVIEAVPAATLVLAGEGDLRASLEAQADALQIGHAVRFLGRVSDDDLVVAYQAADLSVVPTTALEGFGLIVLESLACGTPVVGTDAGGLAEAIAPFDPDLVVPAGDPVALAGTVVRMLQAPSERHSAAACRRHAEQRSWTKVAAQHLALYAEVGGGGGGPRVAFLDHTAALGGGELALERLVLAASGHFRPEVVLGEDGPLAQRLQAEGVSVTVIPFGRRARTTSRSSSGTVAGVAAAAGGAAGWALAVRRHLRRSRPSFVHTNSLKANLVGGLAGRLAGVPVVWHVRDRIAADYLPARLTWLVRQASLRLPSAIIANSSATLACLPAPRVPSTVLPSPLPEGIRRSEGGGDRLRVGMVGRLAPWKGQDVFLRAFASAFAGGAAQAVVIGGPLFGEEAYEASLRSLVRDLGIADQVAFTGFLADVRDELAHLDVLVHASVVAEPFGLVVIEGMAAGLAVIATKAGGPAEIIDDGRTGVLVPCDDVPALTASLVRLGADPALRHRLGDAACLSVAAYEPQAVARALAAFYGRIPLW